MESMNWVIVPVRVNLPMTKKCFDSLRKQDVPVSILAIDNGTEDGCGPWLRAFSDQLIVHHPAKGLTRVWNEAIGMVFEDSDHVLVVNNDTVLRPDTYRLSLEDGGGFVTGIGVDKPEQLTTGSYQKSLHPDFSCFMIRKEVWQKIGPFDESMVTWASDCDYHVRMHRAGIEAYCIGIPFLHVASGTLKNVDPETHQRLCQQADADRETFRNKYGCLPGTQEYDDLFRSRESRNAGTR